MPTQTWIDTILELLISIELNTREEKNNTPAQDYHILDAVRDNFYSRLTIETNWKRTEIKEIFEESIAKAVGKDSF